TPLAGNVAYSVVVDAGKYVVAGINSGNGPFDFALARYNADGTLDGSFGNGAGFVRTDLGGIDFANSVVVDAGKYVVAGYSDASALYNVASGTSGLALSLSNADGTLAGTFAGRAAFPRSPLGGGDVAYSVVVDGGKYVVAGSSDAGGTSDFALARYNPDGT